MAETVVYIESDRGSGSGVVITDDGYLVTCAHVIRGTSELFVKVIANGKAEVYEAEYVCRDDEMDLALVKIKAFSGAYAELDLDRSDPELGEEIVIYGFPFGQLLNDKVMDLNVSFTRGYVSSNQKRENMRRTMLDISAKCGNSGSPVISVENGKVIGILSGSINKNGEEINFMVPINYMAELILND